MRLALFALVLVISGQLVIACAAFTSTSSGAAGSGDASDGSASGDGGACVFDDPASTFDGVCTFAP